MNVLILNGLDFEKKGEKFEEEILRLSSNENCERFVVGEDGRKSVLIVFYTI